jgi:hypothetical protein
MRFIVPIALCVVLATAVAAQQRPQTPLPPSTGTAQISGTIVTDEATPRPVRRAVVTLTMASIPIGRSTTTDDAGRFVFTQLPAGNYSAPRASKPGYVAVTYGEKRVNGIGSPITLTEGQRLAITFKMMRGAVITGMLIDQGRPAAGASVQATAVRVVNGVRVASDSYYYGGGSGSTDDRGIYRIHSLPPGDYIVAVSRYASSTAAPVRPITDAEMQWAQQQFQTGYAGASTIAVRWRNRCAAAGSGRRFGAGLLSRHHDSGSGDADNTGRGSGAWRHRFQSAGRTNRARRRDDPGTGRPACSRGSGQHGASNRWIGRLAGFDD